MKTFVLGLDAACPEILLQWPELVHFRRLMEMGRFGRLESVVPPITVPAWMCLATSQDPGSLGVYGFRNRVDHSYGNLAYADSRSFRATTIWDQFAREGKRSVLVGVPPSYPPRKLNGICVGCFLTPDPRTDEFVYPREWNDRVLELVPDYAVDVKGFRTNDKAWLRDQVFSLSRRQFRLVRHLVQSTEWDYFHFVDIGLDRVQHGFWRFHDPQHRCYEAGNPFETVIRDYYRHLDGELGRLLELFTDEVTILVVSDHGARRLEGAFCVNEFLIREGYLVLDHYPSVPTAPAELAIDWKRTKAWSEGGYYARVQLNVRGREPEGTIDPADYESVRNDLASALEATTDGEARPLGTRVFRPEEIYRAVRGVAPDLVVHFGGLAWRSAGTVGHRTIHLAENDTGPDDCNHAQHGAFILAGPALAEAGEIEGAHLLDMAPTLLDLTGVDRPESMQGRGLVACGAPISTAADVRAEVRERLHGLGYVE